jgi:hypothetical protein
VRNGAAAANSYAADQPAGNFNGMDAADLQAAPYDWNLSAQSSLPDVAVAADFSNYTLEVTCEGAPEAIYHFDSRTGVVADGAAAAI